MKFEICDAKISISTERGSFFGSFEFKLSDHENEPTNNRYNQGQYI